MRRLRALAIGIGVVLGLVIGLGVPVVGAPGSAAGPTLACASDTGPRAALVVDNGARVLRLCVALDAATVSGIHLVELAAAQHGLSYSLGFGKQAVCRLDGVGPTGGDCFAEYPDFWGYWHGNGSGGWQWAGSGAATFRVGEGDVEGWVWGTGDNGSAHRAPPTTHADEVCVPPPSPEPSPSRDPDPPNDDGPSGNGDGTGGSGHGAPSTEPAASASPDEDPREVDRDGDSDEDRKDERATPSVTPSTTATATDDDAADLRATGTTLPDDGGGAPPTGLIAAITLGVALGGVAWWRTRRHPTGNAP